MSCRLACRPVYESMLYSSCLRVYALFIVSTSLCSIHSVYESLLHQARTHMSGKPTKLLPADVTTFLTHVQRTPPLALTWYRVGLGVRLAGPTGTLEWHGDHGGIVGASCTWQIVSYCPAALWSGI